MDDVYSFDYTSHDFPETDGFRLEVITCDITIISKREQTDEGVSFLAKYSTYLCVTIQF